MVVLSAGPDFRLHINTKSIENKNSAEGLEKLKLRIMNHLQQLSPAPSVRVSSVSAPSTRAHWPLLSQDELSCVCHAMIMHFQVGMHERAPDAMDIDELEDSDMAGDKPRLWDNAGTTDGTDEEPVSRSEPDASGSAPTDALSKQVNGVSGRPATSNGSVARSTRTAAGPK